MKELKNQKFVFNYLLLILVLFFCFAGYSQVVQQANDSINIVENDTVKGYNKGKIEMEDPSILLSQYSYDPITNTYIYNKTIEGFRTDYPIVLTRKEYEAIIIKKSIRDYFKSKLDAIDGKKLGSKYAKKDLLPKYYVNSGLFAAIFGSNIIDIQPKGSVEIDFGVRYTKLDNPALSPRNRSNLNFDFNQRISMSLIGKIGTRVGVNINYDTQSTFSFQNLVRISFDPNIPELLEPIEDEIDLVTDKYTDALDDTLNLGEDKLNLEMDKLNLGKDKLNLGKDKLKSKKNKLKDKYNELERKADEVKNLLNKRSVTGEGDSIIKKIELGNVNMPLNSALITGTQSLFGAKAQLQFGPTTLTGVFSEQKSQTKSVVAEGGGSLQDFEIFALDYDADRHFFLSQYFRSKYDQALKRYPFIDSRVKISRVEVWVTNKQNRINTASNNQRNIIALQDLGESKLKDLNDNEVVVLNSPAFFNSSDLDKPSDNSNNKYDPKKIGQSDSFLKNEIREMASSDSGFDSSITVSEGQDYSKLENARKLNQNEYTFHPQLGYISLQQRLSNDEVLAVAFQYNIGDEVYQVGEFANDGVESTVVNTDNQTIKNQNLILKMLKSNLTNVSNPIWNLMMKNIYQIPGAYQIKQENFRFNILYTDPSPINYLKEVEPFPLNPKPENRVSETPLLKVFNMDKLNFNNDPQTGGDGFFDYLPNLTIDTQNGRIIFTTKEPFGELIFDKLNSSSDLREYKNENTYNGNQKKYVFRSLYSTTQAAALQDASKNKYLLKGKYLSSSSDGIPIGAFNIPQGSVVVTAGGRVLVEGIDYTVNYQLGRVQILDPSLQSSNIPINISVENNSTFGEQTRRFFGLNIEHKISEKFIVGATFLKMTEKPFTQKASFDQESVNNSIFGLNTNFSTNVPFFTRLVNKLPNIDTDVPSNLSVRGEIAFLKPDTPKASDFRGESTVYVDDFESSQSSIDIKNFASWNLSSTPVKNPNNTTYNFYQNDATDLNYGSKRARLAWYSIDPVFYTQQASGISNDDISLNATRRVFSQELYPLTDIAQGQTQVINTLDLSYYPAERGPYNNNPSFNIDPKANFGGIMRSLSSTNFELGNIEYIQFWLLDPYVGNGNSVATNTGKLYFNLGEISEDILKDGLKQYENGLGPEQIVTKSKWGDVPSSQSLLYAFDTNSNNRTNQDLGLDGLNNANEGTIYSNFSSENDPAADDYSFYLNTTGDVLNRYKYYNGTEGNSPVDIDSSNRGSSTIPDVEDINRDNTMNTINAYYEYNIDVKPNMEIGENYITDIRETQVALPNGKTTQARWIQFKIPIFQEKKDTIGGISDFRSIRFMRMFLTGFNDQVTLRFGSLDLVRGEWRRYTNSLESNDTNVENDGTNFDVQSVNIQENNQRCPINYTTPPDVVREQLNNSNTIINQNEQSLSLRISGDGLEPNDSRAVFKNVSVDMRQFKKLKMFLHAESVVGKDEINDNEMIGFIRFGNDFNENYYQVEIPLKVSKWVNGLCQYRDDQVWPSENEIDLSLDLLTQLKILAMRVDFSTLPASANGIYYPDDFGSDGDQRLRLGIKGNPNFGFIRNLMVGVKNGTNPGKKINGEVWFNELRVADMDNKGGMAALLNIDTNFADFATLSATGKKSTIGFGSLEQKPNERSREDYQQFNIVTNMNLGKLLPKKWGVNFPFNYAIGEEIITPEYDPFNQDIRLKQLLDNTNNNDEKKNIKNRAIDYTKRRSINFIGVRKDRGAEQKSKLYDIENFTFSQSYNEVTRHNYEISDYTDQQANTTVDYSYSFESKAVEPLKKVNFMKKNSYWKLLSDFNFNYLPSNITFNTNVKREYNRQQFRQVDVEGIPLDVLYRRNFGFNYNYGFNFDLTKSLKINYTASSMNIVKSYLNDNNEPIEGFTIWDRYWDSGDPNQHTQKIVLTYELPLNKIPFLKFIKSNYAYSGDYNWQRTSNALSEINIDGIDYNLGNTIQNSSSHNLNTAFTMDEFYKYIGLVGSKKTKKPKINQLKPGEKIKTISSQNIEKSKKSNFLLDGFIGVLTCFKNIQVNYTRNQGTILPGYTPGVGFFGTSKPTLGFIFGSQDEVRYEAAKNGWLTNYPNFNQDFKKVITTTFKATINVDLFPDFKIDFNFDRSFSENFSEQYDVVNGVYNSRSPFAQGNFSVSTVLIKTAFSTSNENVSAAFEDFRNNRLIIANRLATARGINTADINNIDENGFPKGYGKNSQEVLLPAFLAAYTGTDASKTSTGIFRNIPLPNWVIKYNGLMNYNFFKENFSRFSIQHSYRASYTINEYRSNFEYNKNPNGVDAAGNYFNKSIISNINLVEQFNPLFRIDFELKNALKFLAEMKKDRSLSMSFDNNLLTEVNGIEYIAGFGYRFKDVSFSSRLADNRSGTIKSDIILKADFSYRNNQTIVRSLDYNNNQLAGGQNIWAIKFTADYSFSKNLTALFYYDHSFSKAVISTSFPLTNIRSGFTIRYNFGN